MTVHGGLLKWISVAFVLAITTSVMPLQSWAQDDDQAPAKRQLTPQELLRKRIAESLAGRRDMSAPHSETLIGPELSDREKVIHVLDRLGYGPKPGEVDQVLKNGGWQAWVKQQMEPAHIDDATCDRTVAERFPFTKMSITQLAKDYDGRENQGKIKELHAQLPELVLTRSVLSNRQFKEVMCDFWRNHFCIDQPDAYEKTRSWTSADYEEQVIRKYAFGKFGEMLFASAHHPAMLEYLDNKLSKANNWNENYAREVMELHTLGADRGYGNRDVLELSKALTGWTYDKNFQFVFNPQEHQPGIKYWRGQQLPAGFPGGVQALVTLANDPLTAQFMAEKLCRYLVNDNPPPALIRQVAGVWRETQGDLPKVYAAIINSPEFFKRENYRSKFKTPFQFCVSTLRATNAKVDSTDQVAAELWKMGEPIYNCADPTGYRDQAESWMDSGVLTTRWQFSWDIVRGSVNGIALPDSFLDRYKNLKPEEAEQRMLEDLVGGDVGDRELQTLKEVATNGDLPRMTSIILGSPSFQQR